MAGVREGVGSYVFVFVCICILFVFGMLTVTRTREGVGSCLRICICFFGWWRWPGWGWVWEVMETSVVKIPPRIFRTLWKWPQLKMRITIVTIANKKNCMLCSPDNICSFLWLHFFGTRIPVFNYFCYCVCDLKRCPRHCCRGKKWNLTMLALSFLLMLISLCNVVCLLFMSISCDNIWGDSIFANGVRL